MLDFYFVRHAESQINVRPEYIAGRSNEVELTQKGIEQAKLLGTKFQKLGIEFDKVHCSTAVRTDQTAKLILENLSANYNIIYSDQLLELDQGDWQGKLRSSVYTPEVRALLDSDVWNFSAPNGESQKQVEERMLAYVYDNFCNKFHNDERLLIVTHGFSIRCLLRGILDSAVNMTYKIAIDNTSVTRLKFDIKGWHLLSLNDISHLS